MRKEDHGQFGTKLAGGIVLLLVALGILSGVLIPFFFESQSLWYKFGTEKAMLQWGKAAGLAALLLIVCQSLWVSRLKLLTQFFSLKRSFAIHRVGGILILILVLVHPLLVLWSGGFTMIPLERRYWPEFLGIFLVLLIIITALSSLWRAKLNISHKTWQTLHRLLVPVITIIAVIHARAASETFGFTLPGLWLGLAIVAALALFTTIYIKRFRRSKK
jgi:predicted ferric reductase